MSLSLIQKWIKLGDTTISNVLLQHYRQLGITNNQLILIIQLKSLMDSGSDFPDIEIIAQRMQLPTAKVFTAIHDLIQQKYLTIETSIDKEGKSKDSYQLDFLWERLATLLEQEERTIKKEEQQLTEKDLFNRFESEFGRPLSPMEIQTIGMWLDEDKYEVDLIEMALREAVLSQVYNLKYVDRILLNWEKKNIKTKAQVVQESKRRRNHQTNMQQSTPTNETTVKPKVPLYNWLENQDNH